VNHAYLRINFYPHTFNLAPLYGKSVKITVFMCSISVICTREYLPDELAILLVSVLIMWFRISVIGKKLVKNESYIRERMTFWGLLTRIMDSRG